ncbi:MAG: hypothetical protein PHI32_12735 [Dysgonamonadaceae bacterium]|nr:hypothetical protein [Dysgonamonadaceae bacterium]
MNNQLNLSKACYSTGKGYPGVQSKYPLILNNQNIYPLRKTNNSYMVAYEDGNYSLNEFLYMKKEAQMCNRIALVAYGANRNPINLAWKLRKYRDKSKRPVSQTVIMFPGMIIGADVVAANIFYAGYFFSDLLFHNYDLHRTKTEITVLFVDEKQLEAIHISEEVFDESESRTWGAGVATLPNIYIHFEETHPINALTYVSSTSIYLPSKINKPIAFQAVKAQNRVFKSATQEELISYYLAQEKEIGEIVDLKRLIRQLRTTYIRNSTIQNDIELYEEYIKLQNVIKKKSLSEEKKLITGYHEAKKLGFLLNHHDTWNIPKQFYANIE